MRRNREQVLRFVVNLNEDAEDAVGLGSVGGTHAFSDFFLKHAHEFGSAVLPIEEFEEDLRADVVREVAGDYERPQGLHITQGHAQEIAVLHASLRKPVLLLEELNALIIDVQGENLRSKALDERPCECARSRPDFEDARLRIIRPDSSCDALGD